MEALQIAIFGVAGGFDAGVVGVGLKLFEKEFVAFFDPAVEPMPGFGVAVGEGQCAAVVVARGDEVPVDGEVRVDRFDADGAVLNAVFVLVQKDRSLHGGGIENLRTLGDDFEKHRIGVGDAGAHGDAAEARDLGKADDPRAIRGAVIDADGGVVFIQDTKADVGGIVIGAGVAGDPGIGAGQFTLRAGDAVGRECAVVVVGIESPAERELFEIVEAGSSLRFGFGFAERGDEHAGEDRDDGYHDEQLD